MKKIVSLLLILMLLMFAFVACGKDKGNSGDDEPEDSSEESSGDYTGKPGPEYDDTSNDYVVEF